MRAELIGSDRCEAEGVTVRSAAPCLAMCRKLIEAGYDPTRPLHAYRGSTLCLKVRTLWESSMLECQEGGGFRLRATLRRDGSDDGASEAAE